MHMHLDGYGYNLIVIQKGVSLCTGCAFQNDPDKCQRSAVIQRCSQVRNSIWVVDSLEPTCEDE